MADLYGRTTGGNRRRRHKPTPAQMRRVRREVMLRDDFTCQDCGARAAGHPSTYDGKDAPSIPFVGWLELDHIIRYRDGGEFSVENLRALCSPCNRRRN